jgi:hypothetical protein
VVIAEKIEVDYGLRCRGHTGIRVTDAVNGCSQSMDITFYNSFPIGKSKRSFAYCEWVIDRFRDDPRWYTDRYNVIYNNCHTFAYLLSEALVGEGNLYRFPMHVFESDKFADSCYTLFLHRFITDRKRPALLGAPLANQSNLLAPPSNPSPNPAIAIF